MKYEKRILVGIALIVAIGLIVLRTVWAAAIIQPVRLSFKGPLGQSAGRVIIEKRAFGAVRSADTIYSTGSDADGVDSLNRQFLLGTDTSWCIVMKIFVDSADTYPLHWTISRNLRTSATSYLWNAAPAWNFDADSVVMRLYTSSASSTSLTTRRVRYNVKNYDTTITVNPVFEYDAYFDIYEAGNTDPYPWHWSTRSDTTGSGGGGLPNPGTPQQCALYGYVRDLKSNPIRYAKVTVTLPENVYDSCGGGVIFQKTIKTETDGNGYWGLSPTVSVPKSRCMGNKPVTITISGFNLQTSNRQITVPDSSSHFVKW